MERLPVVICSSVIRSSQQGESHGGVYLVDLESGEYHQVVDWNDPSISWEGRGWDRGLRGIEFYNGHVYLAASDEIFVYDTRFGIVESFRNKYLRHCHEIAIRQGRLYLTSTGFDSVLEFDLIQKRFIRGFHFFRDGQGAVRFRIFDAQTEEGPPETRNFHINNVCWVDDVMYVSGTLLDRLLQISDGQVSAYARIPQTTHNARPYRDGVLCHSSAEDRVVYVDRAGKVLESFPLVRYPEERLTWTHLTQDRARQAFGRGLCLFGSWIIAGSSPSTITVYVHGKCEPVKSVMLSNDIRNAIHGLEVWPYG